MLKCLLSLPKLNHSKSATSTSLAVWFDKKGHFTPPSRPHKLNTSLQESLGAQSLTTTIQLRTAAVIRSTPTTTTSWVVPSSGKHRLVMLLLPNCTEEGKKFERKKFESPNFFLHFFFVQIEALQQWQTIHFKACFKWCHSTNLSTWHSINLFWPHRKGSLVFKRIFWNFLRFWGI